MNRRVAVVVAVLVGAEFAAATYVGLWRSYELAFGVFVVYAFGAWAFVDAYRDWPEDEQNWLQAAFPAFAVFPALVGLPATIPVARRAALGLLVFGAAYGGIFLGMTWALRATR